MVGASHGCCTVRQVSQNPAENLVPNMHEYLAYISQLNERYLRKQGEVFTVSPHGSVCVRPLLRLAKIRASGVSKGGCVAC